MLMYAPFANRKRIQPKYDLLEQMRYICLALMRCIGVLSWIVHRVLETCEVFDSISSANDVSTGV